MKKYLEKLTELYQRLHLSDSVWRRARSVTAFVLVFVTTYSLIIPAITLDNGRANDMAGLNLPEQSRGDLSCHFVVHTHTTDACYTEQPVYDEDSNQTGTEKVLSCGKADWAVHQHDENCYRDGQLICQLPEYEEHVHDASCYETQKVLTCEKEETTGHQHTDACYEEHVNNVCGIEEHKHGEECYETDPDTGGLVLACGLEEHVHSEACYETEKELVCGQEEREGHTHTNACYTEEKVLICDKLELHTHNMSCFETGPNGESSVEMGWVTLETDENGNEILCGDPAHLVCGKVELLKHQHDDSCFLPAENTDAGISADDFSENSTAEDAVPENNTTEGNALENGEGDFSDTMIVMDPAADENQLDDIEIITDEDAAKADAEREGKPDGDSESSGNETSDGEQNGKTAAGGADADESQSYTAFTRTVAVDGASYSLRIHCAEASKIPENAEFRATAIGTSRLDYDAYRSRALAAVDNYIEDEAGHAEEMPGLFDLSIFDKDGNEIQPAAPLSVSIDLGNAIAADALDVYAVHFPGTSVDTVMTPAATNPVTKAAQVISEKISGTGTEVIETTDGKNGAVQFEAESLSVYAIVYTVDFQWEVDGKIYEFSIPGGGFVSLEHVVEVLGLARTDTCGEIETIYDAGNVDSIHTGSIILNDVAISKETKNFVSDVESVEFSSPSLVWVGKADADTTVGWLKEANGLETEYSADLTKEQIAKINDATVEADDWVLISLKPFDTDEILTVTMKSGEVFTICVTDANIAKEDVQDGTGYIIFTKGSDNNYYVLKTDGTAQRFDNADGFDELTNEYKWTVTHVYTEDEQERFNIHSYTNPSYSLALNFPGRDLLAQGANNIIVETSGDGYTFTGFNGTKLNLVQDGAGKKFAGVTDGAAVMYFYEQSDLTTFKFTVTSSDIKMGKVTGRDNVGVMQGETQDCAQYTAATTDEKKNQYTIRAVPQSEKYIFDHWELNGTVISDGATINPEALEIPYNGSSLEAIFKVNPNYVASDDEKEGQGFDNASKAALQAWLNELKNRQVPLNSQSCKKTAEVYDYDNRVYQVDLTAQSSLTTFDGIINLGFIMDVSGSMEFPSKLSPVSGLESYSINQINNGHQNDLSTNRYYYLIADKAGTATVYRLFYKTRTTWTWYGPVTESGWWAVDSSYDDDDNRAFLIGTNSKFSNDTAGTSYQIYTDGDAPHKRKDYLISSVNGTVSDLKDILGMLSLAGSETQNPDVKIAYNTFYSQVNSKQHEFVSAKTFDVNSISWATNGGTATDAAIADAKDFEWGTVNSGSKNYAILITDGAPQAGGRAIANQRVIDQANDLKKGKDNVLGTPDDVSLITVGLSMGDVKRGSVLLYDLADRDADNEKMFFKAESGDELEYVLYDILRKIMVDASVQGNVTDTVGDAFYPVDLTTGEPLAPGNVIGLDGKRISETEGNLNEEQRAAGYGVIQNDGKTIVWTNQTFTHEGWHGTVYVKAKEDLLGGNAVRTNDGNARIQAVSYQTPVMTQPVALREKTEADDKYILEINDLTSPLVNVNELSFDMNKTDWTVYLGTEVDPGTQLEALYKKILVEEKVTAAEDREPQVKDNLQDHVIGGKENYLYPLKQSISDKRESEIEAGKVPVSFTMNDLLKKLVEGKNYDWWNYDKGEPDYQKLFEAASTGTGITLDYDVYGINDMEHHLDDNTVKHDGSTINIKLTKTITEGEIEEGTDPLVGPHKTKITGNPVEKYTLTVLYSPDYEILPEGQGGKSIEDFHVGSWGTMYHGHAAGTETSTNVHTINVYTKPLEVKKVDPEGATLPGAVFGIYRSAEKGEEGESLNQYNSTLAGRYVLVSSGTTDGNGIVRLADTGNTEETLLVPEKDYILIETAAPDNYERDDSVRHVTVSAQSDGKYTDLEKHIITKEVESEGGEPVTRVKTDLTGYEDPYNWSQGVRIAVDGKVIVSADSSQGGGTQTGSAQAGGSDVRELGEGEFIYKTEPLVFQTTILNKKNSVTIDVTKRWTDDKGEDQGADGKSITFKLTRKAGESGSAEDVLLTGHITAGEGISVSDDGSTVTLTWQAGTGWPVARITGLDKYKNKSAETRWIYEAVETICNPDDKVDPSKARYEVTEVNGIQTITIVNIEKKTTQIKVNKKWFGPDGTTELVQAPEESITFEVYRKAHIPCIHDYTNQEWVTEKEATCTENGRKYRECSKCHEKEYAEIPANGHSWSEWTVQRPATYSADGVEVRTCSVCREEETRPITKLPHEHVFDELNYVTNPTCTEPGTARRKCSLCGELSEAIIEVPALGHSWNDGEVTTPATCEETGIRTYTCTRCSETQTREIAALGHDYIYEDDPAATCTTAGTRHWVCRNDESHNRDEVIAALGHRWGEWETYIEATQTTQGENRRYCLNGCGEYESQVVPATGEAYGETGLPVSPYEWPSTIPEGKTQNDTTTVEPTAGIIKCVKNGVTSYYVIYGSRSVNYNQLLQGPDDAVFNDVLIKLTGTIKTKSDVNSNGQLSVRKGDLYQTQDGEYYVCKATGGMVNVNSNDPDSSVRSDTQNWYHIQKPAADAGTNSSNGTDGTNNAGSTNSLNSVSRAGVRSAKKAVRSALLSAAKRVTDVRQGAPAASGFRSGNESSGTADAERRTRIATLLNTTTDQILFRSELNDQSNVDVWEYVDTYTGSGTNWRWELSNLDAYDEDGNEYTYYVIETSPDESLYEISYDHNGIKDSDEGDNIIIKNTQILGSVEVTKTFANLTTEQLPDGFKITASYTENGVQKTVELTKDTLGMTGDGINQPYKWIIDNLRIGTVVTFTESGYDVPGYEVVTNPSADRTGEVIATATAAKTPGRASFINTYTQDVKVTLDLLKIEKDKPETVLKGAVFTLREINSEITGHKPSYKNQEDQGITRTTDKDGQASFSSLNHGYYEIRETDVPDGYVITGDTAAYVRIVDGRAEMIKVNDAGDGWDVVPSAGNFEFKASEIGGTENAKLTVSNEPGAALPHTGGPGTRPFAILGSVLLLGAGLLLWRKRRTTCANQLF